MTMVLTCAGEVGSTAVIELTAEPILGPELSGALVPDIQHSEPMQLGPTPMHTVCHCEVSHDIGVLRNLQPESMWLACHRGGEWIYGRCHCEKRDDKELIGNEVSALLPDSQPVTSYTVDLVKISAEGQLKNTVWRVSASLILELCVGMKWDEVSPIDLLDVQPEYWEMSYAAIAEFSRMVGRHIPIPENGGSVTEVILLSSWPVSKTASVAADTIGKERLETSSPATNVLTNAVEKRLTSLGINEVRPVDVTEMSGRLASWTDSSMADTRRIIQYPKSPEKLAAWIQSLTRRGVARRLRFPNTPTHIRLALQERIRAIDAANVQIDEESRYVDKAPADAAYRPRTLIAMALGSVDKTVTSILLDSGSGISVVSRDFADRHLSQCKSYAYDGPMVQVADKSSVEPIGYIDAVVRVGSSSRLHRFTVFPKLPVDVLLGTDWLYASKAVTDWGRQRLTFAGCQKAVPIKILQHQSQTKLHAITDVIIPPKSGKWVRVETGAKDRIRIIPRATVYTTSDPWCAKHRGLVSPNALITLTHGKSAVFLVNTLDMPMRVKKRNTVAYALPDVPADDLIVPIDDTLYDLASLKVGGVGTSGDVDGKSLDKFNRQIERYQAVCTLMGISPEMLSQDDLSEVARAASVPVDQLVNMVESRRKHQNVDASNLIDEAQSKLADYVSCLNINTHQSVGKDITIKNRDEYVSELYTKASVIEAVRSYFGGVIELDPASCAAANRTVRARRFITKEMDGLKQEWAASRIFVNPPFCDLKQWAQKIKYEAGLLHNGARKELFVVVPCRETEWMKDLLPSTTAVLMPHKRMQFWSERKENIYIRDATWLLYFGPKDKISSVTHRFQNDYTVMLPQEANTGGTMYTPDIEITPDLTTPDDYDPVEHVKIGEKRDLTYDQRRILEELIRKNKKVVNPKPGVCRVAGARIETAEAKPINLPLRRTSPAQRIEIEKQIAELLEAGMIKPSTSPWAAGIVMAPKPDGSWRFCVDYRMLNQVTVRDSYPLPRVDEYLHAMEGNTWFSVMDLNSGFWQIPLHPEDSKKTAFLSHAGLYEWVRMPMGLMNSPAVFQRVMDLAFAGMKWRNLLVYVDDVLVMSPTFEKHIEDLQETFNRLEALGMTVKPKKCQFACGEIKYLGHLLTLEGIKVNPEKVRAISEMSWPDSPEKMASFLGLVSYYRDFVKRCSDICEPLNLISKLSSKEYPKEPTKEQLDAFNDLKGQLTSEDNVLIRPDFEKMFYLQTDASEYGLSAILTQKDDQGRDRVVSYASRTLVKPERKWHSHELEALAAIWGCEHFRPYLAGRKFKLQTDNSSITWLLKQVKPGRLQRCVEDSALAYSSKLTASQANRAGALRDESVRIKV